MKKVMLEVSVNGRLYNKPAIAAKDESVVAFMGENGLQVFRPNLHGDAWVGNKRYEFTGEPGHYFPEIEAAAKKLAAAD